MYANDFEYDGRNLSDYGFVICDIGGDTDMETVSAGGTVTIQNVRHGIGKKHIAVSAIYEECITADFTVAKDPCVYDDMEITDDEMRDLMRWLNKRSYHRMRFIRDPRDENGAGCYYNAAFNAEKICVAGKTVGILLHMTTDSPFGHGERITENGEVTDDGNSTVLTLEDMNDDVGYIYPDMTLMIMCHRSESGTEESESEEQEEEEDLIGFSIVNDMTPDDVFEIDDGSYSGVLARKYIIDGKTMTIRGIKISCSFAAFDEYDQPAEGTARFSFINAHNTKMAIYNWTSGFADGVYRLVVTGTENNGKKYVLKKNTADDLWETVYDNIGYVYSVFANWCLIGGAINYFGGPAPEIGSYIEMVITKERFVVGDSFNYNFVKICNTQDKRTNVIRCNRPCLLEVSYEPIIKLSP